MNEDLIDEASRWVQRFLPLVAAGGRVLDLACGRGRHTRLARALGHPVLALDRDVSGLADLRGDPLVACRACDWETEDTPPFAGDYFAGIIVTHYLYRPHLAALKAALAPDGILIYETFAAGNARFGRPRRADFLLQPDELFLMAHPELRVIAFEQGIVEAPRPAVIQRIAAARCADWTRIPP